MSLSVAGPGGPAELLHSRCVQLEVSSVSDAVNRFQTRNEAAERPLVLIPAHRKWFTFSGWWMTIPTGCHCLMQKFGKDIGKAEPGGRIRPPYYRVAYVVTQQACTYNAPVKECPTSDNVRVSIDVVLVFAIFNAVEFVYRLGAVKFDQLLSGAVDEGIRMLVRSQNHQEVWKLRGNRAEGILKHLNDKFNEVGGGVRFSNCTITSVVLPSSLQSSLESTTEMRKAMDKAIREQEYNLGEIRRKSEMDLEELKRKNEQTVVMENGKKKRAGLDHEQQVVKANEERQVAVIEAQQKVQVQRTEADALLSRTRTDLERYRVETISKAEAEAEARRVQADIEFESTCMNAEADKQKLIGEAKAVEMDSGAEAAAARHLEKKRKHELDMREREILTKLASKANFNLIGEPGDKLVEAVMDGHLSTTDAGGRGNWLMGGR